MSAYTNVDMSTGHVLGLKLKALIMDAIHLIDVVDQLLAGKVTRLDDFAWQKQLR